MAFLASWIQQLILVVIMAAFLDLLLPNNAMQRYVRLVMGLVILMLILSPLITLFKNDWDINSVLQAEQETVGGELESMPRIEEKVSHLQQQQQQLVEENVQKRVETEIAAAVEQQFDVPVDNVAVSFTDDGNQTAIHEIVLTIGNDQSTSEKIVAVDPIRIDVNETQQAKEVSANEQTYESPHFTTIRKWLEQQWLVEESNIHFMRVGEEG